MNATTTSWLAIRAPRSALAPETVAGGLASLAALAADFGAVRLAAVGERRSLTYYAGVSVADAGLACLVCESLPAALRAAFPGAEVEAGEPELDPRLPALGTWWWTEAPEQLPDLANQLARALTGLPDGTCARLIGLLRPAPRRVLARLQRRAARLEQGLGEPARLGLRLAAAPLEALGWLVGGALTGEGTPTPTREYRATPAELSRARAIQARLAGGALTVSLHTSCAGPSEGLARIGHDPLAAALRAGGLTACPKQRESVMSPAELARLLRFPDDAELGLHRVRATRLAAVAGPAVPEIALATANTGGGGLLGVDVTELFRHACVIGPPGTGKTALLVALVLGLAARGVGGLVLDPHGDLVGELLARLPETALDRVDVLDLAAPVPVAINPLHLPQRDDQLAAVRAAAVVEVFDNHWRLTEASAPNFHHHLRMALQALILAGGASLVDLPAFLTDPAFRAQVVARAGDPVIDAHWASFERLGRGERDMAVRSILNKASAFAATPALRAVFGDAGPGLALGDYFDAGRLLVVDLAKGRLPDGCGPMVGALLLTLAHQVAMARQDQPESTRRPAVVVIDEFAELGFAALGKMISAVRKYRLGLVLASQSIATLASIDRTLPVHVLGAAGTKCAFRVQGEDARLLAPAFGVAPTDLSALGAYECYLARFGADGPDVTSGVALPPAPVLRDFDSCRELAAARRPQVARAGAPLTARMADRSGW
ncbi:MAG: type IV secretory system conjugative DNA transfer family protein [Mycobacteriales bacterium]